MYAHRDVDVEATPTDTNASVEYLDSNGDTLVDSNTTKDGLQYTFPVGTNTFTVKVTAEDGNTTKLYTLDATRTQGTVCTKPTLTDRVEVWSGTLVLDELWYVNALGNKWPAGYGYFPHLDYNGGGTLSDTLFEFDSNSYTISLLWEKQRRRHQTRDKHHSAAVEPGSPETALLRPTTRVCRRSRKSRHLRVEKLSLRRRELAHRSLHRSRHIRPTRNKRQRDRQAEHPGHRPRRRDPDSIDPLTSPTSTASRRRSTTSGSG